LSSFRKSLFFSDLFELIIFTEFSFIFIYFLNFLFFNC
jgi:hypothetical protein